MKRASIRQLVHAVKVVGGIVGAGTATYCFEGRIAVPLGGGWALAISPDDAERLRVEACFSGRVLATMWVLADDGDRLAELVAAARAEVAALAA